MANDTEVVVPTCSCGCTSVMHEEHVIDERIYQTTKARNRSKLVAIGERKLVKTAKNQILSQRWYCNGCGALLKEVRGK